jgi:hypothetical protein
MREREGDKGYQQAATVAVLDAGAAERRRLVSVWQAVLLQADRGEK